MSVGLGVGSCVTSGAMGVSGCGVVVQAAVSKAILMRMVIKPLQ